MNDHRDLLQTLKVHLGEQFMVLGISDEGEQCWVLSDWNTHLKAYGGDEGEYNVVIRQTCVSAATTTLFD